jgi:hypothetical protein
MRQEISAIPMARRPPDSAWEIEMNGEDKKTAISTYKKHKAIAGIFAVRCAATGQVWIGQSPNLDTIQNRIWFALRLGSHSNHDLQGAWATHGAENFSFETLERLKDEELSYVRDALLRERGTHWRSTLNGSAI